MDSTENRLKPPPGIIKREVDGETVYESDHTLTASWWGRGLSIELGTRAFGCLVIEQQNRRIPKRG